MFSTATITDGPNCSTDGDHLRISFTSSSPNGTTFQVYVDRVLSWHGTNRVAVVGLPTHLVAVQVGTVAPGEDEVDFSASLPALLGTGNKASIGWLGGRFEALDTAGFHVYSGTAPGGAISYTTPVATINAAPGGLYLDGFGLGGFGSGGYGYAAVPYSWTSGPLAPGVWNFGIKPFDAAGNEGSATTVAVTIATPPRPPAAVAGQPRLRYTYNSGSRIATLTWLAAPT